MPESTPAEITITASALIRQGDSILLVYQHREQDPYPTWALPGGRLEQGESLAHGLVREVREETGLIIERIGSLVSVAHLVDRPESSQAVSFVFEVGAWGGTLSPADPDGVAQDARFFSTADAIPHLERIPWRAMYEPVVSYLRGSHPAGTVWLYAEHGDTQRLLASLPEQPQG